MDGALPPFRRLEMVVAGMSNCFAASRNDSVRACTASTTDLTRASWLSSVEAPRVVPDMRHPAMDNVGMTATTHGSGVERTVQEEYRSAMSRDESPTPGPKARFPEMGQPSVKGKERATDEQPVSSAKRCFDETWLLRVMERIERRIQATTRSSLDVLAHNVNDLGAHVTAIEE